MKTYEYEELEAKFKKLPKNIQVALTSVEVADEIKNISEKHGLLLDQTAVLFDVFSYILLGLLPAADFVKTFSKESNVSEKVATTVAEEVNSQVFSKIRSSIQATQDGPEPGQMPASPSITPKATPAQQDITTLEKAGGFSVEQQKDDNENTSDVSEKDKYNILTEIENPLPAKEVAAKQGSDESYAEPLVDHLLNTASAQPEEKIVEKSTLGAPANPPANPATSTTANPAANPPPATETKPKGPDPYLEPTT
jgi:hypothetical protein